MRGWSTIGEWGFGMESMRRGRGWEMRDVFSVLED